MRIRNGDELDLEGANTERITVAVDSSDVINYVLNNKPWGGGSFVLDKHTAPVYTLLVTVTYKDTSGGGCLITVTGSNGGDVSDHDENQAPGEPSDEARYTFTIV
jgi:hypothetical protein